MPMWEGRFSKNLDKRTNDFNSSIKFDYKLYKEDIAGSIAHAKMLAKQNIIQKEDEDKIIFGLNSILKDIESGNLEFDPNAEDIHMFIESELTKRIGNSGKKLHTARSRNDQVALDVRMYLKKQNLEIIKNLKKLITTLIFKAKENTETIMPGYTHMQRAQPITFAHHLMAYAEMFKRDIERLNETYTRTDICPIGSCALAGTTYNLDREFEAKELGFSKVSANSLDGVSDRDFVIELLSDISIIMMHLSRISEEIILWSSWEFKFIELDDSFSTGSSIMPQKKNPDITELIRGKTGRVYGNLMGMLTVMKGTPLAYNKDMQEDKELIFDAIDTVNLSLSTINPLIDTMLVLKENMKAGAEKGFINATDCADYLVEKGIPFRDAYKIVGNIVKYCIQNNITLEKLDIKKYKEFNDCFEEDIFNAVDLMNCVNKRDVIGGPSKRQVEFQIAKFEKWLKM
ncbi:MAG TPA: argininosuccinate lyase [Clostridiaceae bacterium]|nr:argininosuccinate lyase [Clostridium sp.]MEE0126749.1 argininosuccinate lyase [Clostridia bacterium]HJJ12107.1 argininosuccinate lyase [Clostridiaceae bacterium]